MPGLGSHRATSRLIADRGAVFLTAPAEAPPPQPLDTAPEGGERLDVVGHGMIGEVASHDLPQPGALLVDRGVQAASHGLLDLAQPGPQPVAPRLPLQGELAVPGAPTDVGEAQEVEGLRLAEAAPLAVCRRMATELDQTRLVRMQTEHIAFQSLSQGRKKPHGVGLVLETGDEVVGVAHHDDVSLGMAVSPPPPPTIQGLI